MGRDGNQYSMLLGGSFIEGQDDARSVNNQLSEISDGGLGNSTQVEQKSRLLMKLEENLLNTRRKELEEKKYLEMEKVDYSGNIKIARLWKNDVVMDMDVFKNESEDEISEDESGVSREKQRKQTEKYEKEIYILN
jgi:hypothetical protein